VKTTATNSEMVRKVRRILVMMASFSFTKIAERLERNPLSDSDLPSSVPSGRD
jgi:hypothetical protein